MAVTTHGTNDKLQPVQFLTYVLDQIILEMFFTGKIKLKDSKVFSKGATE
jgi:hypothetical protein